MLTCIVVLQDVEGLNIAAKDMTRSAFDIWTSLLSTGNHGTGRGGSRNKRTADGSGAMGNGSIGLEELCSRVHDFGDMDLVVAGVHENVPSLRFLDVNMSRTSRIAECMAGVDCLMR